MALPVEKENRYTYDDYISWPDEERWELIDGVPFNMSPAPSRSHQVILRELLGQFWSFLQDRPGEVYSVPFDVRLPKADEEDKDIQTVVQPDILVVCDRNKLDEKGCRGVPDLIIEIVSPYTASKDMKEKFSLCMKGTARVLACLPYREGSNGIYSGEKRGIWQAQNLFTTRYHRSKFLSTGSGNSPTSGVIKAITPTPPPPSRGRSL